MGQLRTFHALPLGAFFVTISSLYIKVAADNPASGGGQRPEASYEELQAQLKAAQETVAMQQRLLELEREMRDLKGKLADKDSKMDTVQTVEAPSLQDKQIVGKQIDETNSLAAGVGSSYEGASEEKGYDFYDFVRALLPECVMPMLVGAVAYVITSCYSAFNGNGGSRHAHDDSTEQSQGYDDGQSSKRRPRDTPYQSGRDRRSQAPHNAQYGRGPQAGYRQADMDTRPLASSTETSRNSQFLRHEASEGSSSISRASQLANSLDTHIDRGLERLIQTTSCQQPKASRGDSLSNSKKDQIIDTLFKEFDDTTLQSSKASLQPLNRAEIPELRPSWSQHGKEQSAASTPPPGLSKYDADSARGSGASVPPASTFQTRDGNSSAQHSCADSTVKPAWFQPPPGLTLPSPHLAPSELPSHSPPPGFEPSPPPGFEPLLPSESEPLWLNATAAAGCAVPERTSAAVEPSSSATLYSATAIATEAGAAVAEETQARAPEEAPEEEVETTESPPEEAPEEAPEVDPPEVEEHTEEEQELEVDQKAEFELAAADDEDIDEEEASHDELVVADVAEGDDIVSEEISSNVDARGHSVLETETKQAPSKRQKKQQQKQPLRQQPFGTAESKPRLRISFVGWLKTIVNQRLHDFLHRRKRSETAEFAEEPKPHENRETKKKVTKVKQVTKTKHASRAPDGKHMDIPAVWSSLKACTGKGGNAAFACVAMLIVILLGKVVPGKHEGTPDDPNNPCSNGTWPSYVNNTLPVTQPEYNFPYVTLYAPCLYKSYREVARKFHRSASGWYFVHSPFAVKVELRQRNEEVISLLSVPQNRGLQDENAIVQFLQDNIIPKMGILTDVTYEFYVGWEQGLVWALPEPGMTIEAIDKEYRSLFHEVSRKFRGTYYFAFIDTETYATKIESELGITSFPKLVIQRVAGSGMQFVYDGKLVASDVIEFIQDVENGCFDYFPFDPRRSFRKEREPLNPVCDAEPVFRPALARISVEDPMTPNEGDTVDPTGAQTENDTKMESDS